MTPERVAAIVVHSWWWAIVGAVVAGGRGAWCAALFAAGLGLSWPDSPPGSPRTET